MANEGPHELRFDFVDESTVPEAPPGESSAEEEKATSKSKRADERSVDSKVTPLRVTPSATTESSGGANGEDHAAELKRRVAELRTAARRSKSSTRPLPAKTRADDAEFTASAELTVSTERAQQEAVQDRDAASIVRRTVVEFDDIAIVEQRDMSTEALGDPFGDPFEEPVDVDDEFDQLDEALTIALFYERVRRALAQEFTEEIWVSGEIRGFREARGHRYLELADKGVEVVGRGVAQQLEVVCWARDWPPIARALSEVGVDLEVGRVVRVRGKVSVWEGGSKLRFTLTALDVEALVGGIAAARRRLLATLAEEDLLEANRRLPLALVPLRIGIVTSQGSEAHRDFVGQLERSGFAFEVHLEPTLVQGTEAPVQIAAALERMRAFAPELVAVIRGGGARGDLAAFDDERVARAIATAPFPIWTGIGHTSDRSVADEVAQRSLITPTACGEAVVEVVDVYWGEAMRRIETASRLARNHLESTHRHISTNAASLVKSVRHQLGRRSDGLVVANHGLSRAAQSRLSSEATALNRNVASLKNGGQRAITTTETSLGRDRQLLNAFDPTRQLERGWALVHDEEGRLVRSLDNIAKGDRLHSRVLGGHIDSVVESIASDQP